MHDGRRRKQDNPLYDRRWEVAGFSDVAGWAHLAEPKVDGGVVCGYKDEHKFACHKHFEGKRAGRISC